LALLACKKGLAVQWTDEIKIETPEQIDVSLEVAGLGSRFLARALDWVFKFILLMALLIPGGVFLALLSVPIDLDQKRISTLLAALIIGVAFLIWTCYDIYFEVRHNGQTPGKRQAGIRVIRDTGAPIDFRVSCIRNLLSVADFLPAFYLFGALLVLLTSRRQRLGDLAAGTLVIRERAVGAPVDVPDFVAKLASSQVAFTADQLAACPPESLGILRSFFQRYGELNPEPRRQLAARLVANFSSKMASPPVVPTAAVNGPPIFLASLYRDLQANHQHGQ
jgi:uncharacterized RDD family membrane protein YckC